MGLLTDLPSFLTLTRLARFSINSSRLQKTEDQQLFFCTIDHICTSLKDLFQLFPPFPFLQSEHDSCPSHVLLMSFWAFLTKEMILSGM